MDKPESGAGTDDGGVIFRENGADLSNWQQSSNPGSANGWAGSGSEDSRILGADAFYLYAGGPDPGDGNPCSKLWRMFPDDLALGAGAVLSFRFAHGDIGGDSGEGIGSVGWNLLNGDEDSWHAAAPDELPPLDGSGRLFSIGTSGAGPKLFIRLVLRPGTP